MIAPLDRKLVINRALRVARALLPGESAAVVVCDTRPYTNGDRAGSTRLAFYRRPASGDYHVELECPKPHTHEWEPYDDDGAFSFNCEPADLRTVVSYFVIEAENSADDIIGDREYAAIHERKLGGIQYFTPPVLVTNTDFDCSGYPSVAYRVVVNKTEQGNVVSIETSLGHDPDKWEPTDFGRSVGSDFKPFVTIVPDEEVDAVVDYYRHIASKEYAGDLLESAKQAKTQGVTTEILEASRAAQRGALALRAQQTEKDGGNA